MNAAGSGAPEQARIPPYLRTGGDPPAPTAPAHPRSARQPPAGRPNRPRPFILTAGRVRSVDPEISLETQVTACASAPGALSLARLPPELRAIIELCARPISVAEISAKIPLHLGVAKILVGDLRALGYLEVHVLDTADPSDPELILRVIRGLRALAA